ncbi:MAG: GH25 family lysozyme [Succiniclasticum sp.]|uniref:GH25 family lysozyme n=1 Tax=Succiniclasticum sp. TaxID=2775030 RepID=UPI002A914820|nr:GH25 family lysozyme [Succiniclasticum sp.]MDY6292280.1 GH25 family lysozyme [Succiniclasticum sp.]
MRLRKGIDVSENNGHVDWQEVKANGIEFAIIRLGYGKGHLDSLFYENINGALDAGLKVGVYYYSYALNRLAAWQEASYMMHILESSGLSPGKLEMGIWFDMEDGDGYKARNGMPSAQTITAMCDEFITECNRHGYNCGIYASLDWLENRILMNLLPEYVPVWCAQWSHICDWKNPAIWQFTDSLKVGQKYFDGNYVFD